MAWASPRADAGAGCGTWSGGRPGLAGRCRLRTAMAAGPGSSGTSRSPTAEFATGHPAPRWSAGELDDWVAIGTAGQTPPGHEIGPDPDHLVALTLGPRVNQPAEPSELTAITYLGGRSDRGDAPSGVGRGVDLVHLEGHHAVLDGSG